MSYFSDNADWDEPNPIDERMSSPVEFVTNAPARAHSEEENAVLSLTMTEFVSLSKNLLQTGDMANFSRFVLNGLQGGVQHQVDPIKNALEDDHRIEALRDYDSVLGIHADVCVNTALTMYPVSKFEDTLRRNIHIKISFANQFGEHTNVPIHHIPNLCIAKWGTHNMIRILLPALYDGEGRSPFLTQAQLTTFYEKGLRPMAVRLAGASASEWPPTYSAEMFRARGKNGTLSFQTKTLPSWRVGELGDRIRESLRDNDVRWGEGLLFLHQIRGVKSSNGHSVTADAASSALINLIDANHLAANALQTGDWWVDVGLEIASIDGQCLAWRTDSHFHVVKNALNISSSHAVRITRPGSSKYLRDLTSHLVSVSGCRICPGVRAQGPSEALYLQMYTTDKSLTYRPEGSHFGKFLRGEDIIKGKADDYCHDLYELYRNASTKNSSLARLEVRVPMEHASSVLLDMDVNNFRNGLVAFQPTVWWSLRAYRALAFKYILEQQERGSSSLRGTNSALLLTASAPWFLNGLHSAPDNGPSSRDLMGKILPLVNRVNADIGTLAYPASTRAVVQQELEEDDDDDADDEEEERGGRGDPHEQEDNISVHSGLSDDEGQGPPANIRLAQPHTRLETLPYNPYGIVFLREIRVGEGIIVPRFRDTTVGMITPQTFRYIFGINREDVDSAFFKAQTLIPPNPKRVSNKTHSTAIRIIHDEVEAPSIFNLAARGYRLPPRQQDEGSDIGDVIELTDDDDDDGAAGNATLDIDQKLTQLWRQFLVDLTAKVSNRKGAFAPSYCILSKSQRDRVDDATYRNLRLRSYFDDCQYRTATKADWNAAFDKCWPIKGKLLTTATQNYPRMKYYVEWGILINNRQPTPVEEMRQTLRKRFFTLKWIPNVQSDRVWYTKPDTSFKKFPECDPTEPAPRILIRWNEEAII